MKGVDARKAAHILLEAVLVHRRMLSEAVQDINAAGPDLARGQRLASLTLRYLSQIDAALAKFVERRPAQRSQTILRLAVAELRLDNAAPHGVVSSAVSAARSHPKARAQAGMINAVLRQIAEDTSLWESLPAPTLPPWLRKHVAKAYGQERLAAIEAAHLVTPALDLTAKDMLPDSFPGITLPSGSQRLETGQVTTLPGFEEGAFWVQDMAAAQPVRSLGALEGLRVLDLCAAPGGKTMQLAAAGAEVTALDVSEGRLKRLRDNLKRTQLEAEIVIADALEWQPEMPFDVVLLDAPCSATGTIRRHPDLPFLRRSHEIEELTKLQYQLFDRAISFVKSGGRLLYCTCSLLPVEGEFQIKAALKRHPELTLLPLDPEALGLPSQTARPEGLRLLPDLWPEHGGMDGFFIAQIQVPA